jgi:uncharacterized protein YceK
MKFLKTFLLMLALIHLSGCSSIAQNIAALNQSIGSNKPGRFTNRVMVKSA